MVLKAMKTFTLNLPNLKMKVWLLIGLVLAIIILLVAATTHTNDSSTGSRSYYFKQLGMLKQDVTKIKSIEHPSNLQDTTLHLDEYRDALTSSIGNCREMDIRYVHAKNNKKLEKSLNKSAKVAHFCKDYETVASYAFKLASTTGPLLEYRLNSTLDSTQQSSLNDTLASTKQDLEKLKKDPFNDPAGDELLVYVETIQKQIVTGNTFILQNTLHAQQANILNARRYYWDTTVDIFSIQHSLDKLQGQFKK